MSLRRFERAYLPRCLSHFIVNLLLLFWLSYLIQPPALFRISVYSICYAFCFWCEYRWRFYVCKTLLKYIISSYRCIIFVLIFFCSLICFVLFYSCFSWVTPKMFSTKILLFYIFPICCRMCGELQYMQCNIM